MNTVGFTRQGSEGPLSCLPHRLSLPPLRLRQQPQLLSADLLLSQKEQRVGQTALHRRQVFIYVS